MKTTLVILALLLTGCVSTSSHNEVHYSDTMEIIRSAAEAAPLGVEGIYTLKIKAAGMQRAVVYLNTEEDYRDQRNITISLHPKLIAELTAKYGEHPEVYWIGKTIEVRGQAKRARIVFSSNGRPTDKYYYQTHIRVSDASQIKVLIKS